MDAVAKFFEAELLDRLNQAEELTGYGFGGIRKVIAAKGGVGAALQLLDFSSLGRTSDGFKVLMDNDLLRYSLEKTVLDWKSSGLFPPGIIASARARLILARKKLADEQGPSSNGAPS